MLVRIGSASSNSSKEATIDTQLLQFTTHATLRGAQRSLSEQQAEYVRQFGARVRRTGCTFYVLRRRDIPREHLRNDAWAKLEGAILLVDEGHVITAYYNKEAWRDILKKPKYRRKAA
jgi:hypothetical protein